MLYIFDGTKNGFLCALLAAYTDPTARLVRGENNQLFLGELPILVKTDEQKAGRAERRLAQFDRDSMRDLDVLLRSGNESAPQIALEYFRLLAEIKRPIKDRLALPAVFAATECMRKVGREIHHLHGFIRFMETASGALYAPFEPDNDVCDLLLPHFKARLPHYAFVLHDVKRKKAAIYDGQNVFLAPLNQADVVLSASEDEWQSLWKKYYNAVNIPSRERLKQMRGYMPVRYWKYMPEKHDESGNLTQK